VRTSILLKYREIYPLQILPLVKFIRRDRLESFAEADYDIIETDSALRKFPSPPLCFAKRSSGEPWGQRR